MSTIKLCTLVDQHSAATGSLAGALLVVLGGLNFSQKLLLNTLCFSLFSLPSPKEESRERKMRVRVFSTVLNSHCCSYCLFHCFTRWTQFSFCCCLCPMVLFFFRLNFSIVIEMGGKKFNEKYEKYS